MKKKLKYKNRYDIIFSYLAPMAELVDAADSKSASSNRVPVQVRMGAPKEIKRTLKRSFFMLK